MSAKNTDFYANKTILAPMVRGGRAPLRNIVLEYGADLAYTEELIDDKLISAKRKENDLLKTIDYTVGDHLALRITKTERPKCVLQVGSCDTESIIKVCNKYSNDVAAIDINMGCPKPFSLLGGRGAALLSKPDLVKEMITSLVNVSPIPISCKIRVLNTLPETLEFAKMLENCGISALGVHGRQKDERPGHKNRPDEIREVARALNIPVIANGESSSINEFEDIAKSKEKCGTSSIMLARCALSQPSIFRSEGLLSMQEEIERFLDKAILLDEDCQHTKYVVQRILGGQQAKDERGQKTVQAITLRDICRVWNKEELYNECQQKLNQVSHKRKAEQSEDGTYKMDVTFPPKRMKENSGSATPKCILNKYCEENRLAKPSYETTKREIDKKFTTVVHLGDKKFASTIPQSSKRTSEQVSALCALHVLDLKDRLVGNWEY